MKSEDFERLKAVCEKEGFDVLNLTHDDNEKYVLVKKAKDEWEGVEFVESIWSGKIFPISQINYKPDKSEFGISTEQAYIDQLKAKAFELYGEIKEGDRLDCSEMGYNKNASILISKCLGLYYSKKFDSLELCGFTLYKQGKWAKKIDKEMVKVEWVTTSSDTIRFNYGNAKDVNLVKLGPELAKLIEEYLNK